MVEVGVRTCQVEPLSVENSKFVMALPLSLPAVKATESELAPAVTAPIVGASAISRGVEATDVPVEPPTPFAFTALN